MTAAKCYDLLLFAAVPDSRMLDQGFYAAEAEGLRNHPAVRSVTATNQLSVVRTASYDGLLGYFYSHAAAAAGIARLRGKRAILTGGGEQLFRDQTAGLARWGARMLFFQLATVSANRLFATSTSDFDRMRALAVFGRRKVALSYHGAEAVDRIDREDFSRDRPPASFVTISGLDTPLNVRRKGVLAAVDLLAGLLADNPEARLTIIGRTTCRGMVEDHARIRGVSHAVTFAGYVSEEEKQEMLRSHRFYVQLSEYEGFGIGALEALALGCHVIHSDVGGLRDTVGRLGIILAPAMVDDFSVASVGAYPNFEWEGFIEHMAQFKVERRAAAIVSGLGLAPYPSENLAA